MATQNPTRLGLGDGGPLPDDRTNSFGRWVVRWVERLLIAFGVLCLGYYIYAISETYLYQSFEDHELNEILNSPTPAPSERPAAPVQVPRRAVPTGAMIGRIEIPR